VKRHRGPRTVRSGHHLGGVLVEVRSRRFGGAVNINLEHEISEIKRALSALARPQQSHSQHFKDMLGKLVELRQMNERRQLAQFEAVRRYHETQEAEERAEPEEPTLESAVERGYVDAPVQADEDPCHRGLRRDQHGHDRSELLRETAAQPRRIVKCSRPWLKK
jgi:hypothetical protein